jgi:hypothetical protein
LWKINRPTRGFATFRARRTARDHAVISTPRTAAEKGSLINAALQINRCRMAFTDVCIGPDSQ